MKHCTVRTSDHPGFARLVQAVDRWALTQGWRRAMRDLDRARLLFEKDGDTAALWLLPDWTYIAQEATYLFLEWGEFIRRLRWRFGFIAAPFELRGFEFLARHAEMHAASGLTLLLVDEAGCVAAICPPPGDRYSNLADELANLWQLTPRPPHPPSRNTLAHRLLRSVNRGRGGEPPRPLVVLLRT